MIYYSGVFTYLLLMSCAMFYATNASCSSSQFTCNNGNCVPSSYKCDYYDDCRDNSDEFGCGSCYSYQFHCFNGQCIDATLACNGVSNCNDGSDESRCTYTCPNGAVRLVGTGSNQASGYGRVEVCYNNTWGTICGSSWSYNAATVVCRQLGFSGYSTYSSSALYGQGTGSIFLYGLYCYGTESSLLYCSYSGSVVSPYCYHSQDASVTCYGSTSQTTIATTTTPASCSSSQFTCNNGKCVPSSYKCDKYDDCGDNSDEFGCYCYSYQFQCFNGQCIDATLACNRVSNCNDGSDESRCTYTCPNGAVRLVGTGSNQASGYGRVEMCYNNTWGTICGSSWSYNAATVVCRQLGFLGYSTYSYSALYGQGTGSILLNGLYCYGSESSLLYCSYSGSVVTPYCSHSQDASVTCYGSTSTPTSSSSSIGVGIGVSVFVLVFIVVFVITVVRVYARQAIIRRGLQTRVVTNAPAATTIVTTTTQNSTPQTAGFDPSKGYTGYTGYAPPPSYPATGYPSTGYPATGSTGYPATGSTGYPATGSTGYPATGFTGYPAPGSTGYPAPGSTGYPAPGSTGYPTTGSTGYPAPGSTGYPAPGYPTTGYPTTGYPGAPPPYPS